MCVQVNNTSTYSPSTHSPPPPHQRYLIPQFFSLPLDLSTVMFELLLLWKSVIFSLYFIPLLLVAAMGLGMLEMCGGRSERRGGEGGIWMVTRGRFI